MVVFLTSSPTGPLDGSRKVDGLDKKNGFVDNLRKYWQDNSRCCIIAASPDEYDLNDDMCDFFRNVFLKEGFSIQCFDLIDRRYSIDELDRYDVIILGGGHVPTQNRYFNEIDLKEKIRDFKGIVIGISAGSMNSADVVYCQPEEAGEAIDPNFKRWISGLALTKTNILPHYQMVKDRYLDGMRLYEEITYQDSFVHPLITLVDGCYILIDGDETIYGKSYLIDQGKIELICHENETKKIR